jgi:Leucine-rich repeat (LRR) protein
LTNNFLVKLDSNQFGELDELTGLDLSFNLIHIVSVNAFAKLPSLLWLNMANNCLNTVALSLPLHALFSLNLAHNGIIEFPQLSGAINAITLLNLSHNKISDLKIDFALTKTLVKNIHTLDISDNQLKHPNQLLDFANLIELNLAGNGDIDYTANEKFVRHFNAMKKLNLTRTNLTSLDIFRHVNGVHFEELSLTSNPLTTNFEELSKFSNLERLEFQQKFCNSFDSYRAIRRNFKSLKSVKILYDDDLNCKCIRWNKMQFEFEAIEFLTDWSICDNEPDCGGRRSMSIEVFVMSLFVALIVIKIV